MRKFGSLDEHAGIVEVDFSHEELARIDAE
jgi:hypothetical protein